MKETWRDVLGGYYQVSNLGRLKRVRLSSGKAICRYPTGSLDECGYPRFCINLNGDVFNKRLHCLVAEGFLGVCPDGYEVNHKNFDRTDCSIANLEYITHTDNIKYSFLGGRHRRGGSDNNNAILTETDVRNIRELYKSSSLSQNKFCYSLAIRYGVSKSTIYFIVTRATWKVA